MVKIYAIANQKGGVGKTTTTMNLGAALAERGKKVLLVDLDQQGSLTTYCGLNPEQLNVTIYNVFSSYIDLNREPVALAPVIKSVSQNVDLVPANEELAALDLELIHAYSREQILQKALLPVQDRYDYILLDCPPNLSLLVVNALVAATDVIVTLQADYLATKGVTRLLKIVQAVQTRLNPRLSVSGILLTMADQRTIHTREIIKRTRSNFEGKVRVFDVITKMSVRLKDAPITGRSILAYDGESEAAESFRRLAEEVERDQVEETIHAR
ncbi:MAG: AAA family ATPase [Ktedonobacteraceae bacterium]